VAAIAGLAILILIMSRAISRRIVGPLKTVENSVEAVSGGQNGLAAGADRRSRNRLDYGRVQPHAARTRTAPEAPGAFGETRVDGTMLSGVAHELNNPLSNISTSCQILLEEWSGGRCRDPEHAAGAD